jgi:hypothetical protein
MVNETTECGFPKGAEAQTLRKILYQEQMGTLLK